MFKFYFDNNLVSDPINWSDFTETIEWKDDIKGILPKYELQLTFTGGAYKYLYDLRRSSGYCNMVQLRVEQSCDSNNFETILTGYISISRCIFNLNKCSVDCDIIDDNYGAMISNNKSIKTSFSDKSKNGTTIASAALTLLVPFDCATGIYGSTADARNAVSIYEAFKFLVLWMSDGRMGFKSLFLADSNNVGCILTGHQLRNIGSENYPIVSFQQLFQEIDRKKNIGFTIIDVAGVKTLQIENIDYFYSTASGVTINSIEDLKESFDPEKLYSGVKLGGKIAAFDPLIHNFVPRQFIGFDTEEFGFMGICNIDKQLDLTCEYLCDTNMIEELTVTNTSNEEYDKDIFLVKGTTSGGFYYADQFAIPSGGFMYNKEFTNEYSSQSHDIYGDTILYTGLINNNFRAETTNRTDTTFGNLPDRDFGQFDGGGVYPPLFPLPQSSTVQAKFNDDSTAPNTNVGGNYNNSTTWAYTAPLEGSYFFETNIYLKIFEPPPSLPVGINRKWRIDVALYQYDSSNVLVNTFTNTYPGAATYYALGEGFYNFSQSAYINCSVGDYVQVFCTFISEPILKLFDNEIRAMMTNTSYFQTTATPSGGGVFQEGDNTTYRVSKLEFDYPISREKYALMKADLTKSLSVTHDNELFSTAWIRKTSRNLETGQMSFELISNLENT